MATAEPIRERRRAERMALIELASTFAARLGPELRVVSVVVFGSVSRGDFNRWSDVDVLVLAEALPDGARARHDALAALAPTRVSVIAWTPDEFERALARNNPIATESLSSGVVVRGQPLVRPGHPEVRASGFR